MNNYPDDPDEYVQDDEQEREGDDSNNKEKVPKMIEMNSDILLNGKSEFDMIIICLDLIACTCLSLFLTSDNPEYYDNHYIYGYQITFSFTISVLCVPLFVYIYRFAANI